MKLRTKDMILCAVFAAVLSVFSVMTIPIGIVPITMSVFGVLITAVILGWKKGLISTIIFILLGCVGLPVFSGFKGGVQVLVGPTGGYITGYLLMVLVVGAVSDKIKTAKWQIAVLCLCIACVVGVAICYIFGTIQYILIAEKTIGQALALCVYPFIPLDMLKCIAAAGIGYTIRSRSEKTIY